jgi:methylated-DNA-protein-cysteine methyltransferase-like protein
MTKAEEMRAAIRQTILSIPRGKVATYGQVAEAAGYPRYHRQVAQVLNKHGEMLPWHRVLGAGGQLKTGKAARLEQRMLLEMEGVRFRGARVDMKQHQNVFFIARSRAPRRQS